MFIIHKAYIKSIYHIKLVSLNLSLEKKLPEFP